MDIVQHNDDEFSSANVTRPMIFPDDIIYMIFEEFLCSKPALHFASIQMIGSPGSGPAPTMSLKPWCEDDIVSG